MGYVSRHTWRDSNIAHKLCSGQWGLEELPWDASDGSRCSTSTPFSPQMPRCKLTWPTKMWHLTSGTAPGVHNEAKMFHGCSAVHSVHACIAVPAGEQGGSWSFHVQGVIIRGFWCRASGADDNARHVGRERQVAGRPVCEGVPDERHHAGTAHGAAGPLHLHRHRPQGAPQLPWQPAILLAEASSFEQVAQAGVSMTDLSNGGLWAWSVHEGESSGHWRRERKKI